MLFLILLDYQRPLSDVDRHMDGHRAFLRQHYAAGHLLLSGRKQPRSGGVILARADSRADVEQWIAADPFHRHGIASYEIIAWEATMRAPEMPDC